MKRVEDFESAFTEEEKLALALLVERGFLVFADAKLEDVRQLDGSRHRTFRNQGRYDLILALKKIEKTEVEAKGPDAGEDAHEAVDGMQPGGEEPDVSSRDPEQAPKTRKNKGGAN